MNSYLSETAFYELRENKSRFLAYVFPVTNKQAVNNYLQKLKAEHPKADHFCFAYLLDENRNQKYSDDGEPAGTAGLPILNVLQKKNLDEVLAVVVRYFGGIKLGASGLTKAYRNCLTQALRNATFVTKTEVALYRLVVPYNIKDTLNKFLTKNCEIVSCDYETDVTYVFYCGDERLIQHLTELTNGLIPVSLNKTKIIKTNKEANE